MYKYVHIRTLVKNGLKTRFFRVFLVTFCRNCHNDLIVGFLGKKHVDSLGLQLFLTPGCDLFTIWSNFYNELSFGEAPVGTMSTKSVCTILWIFFCAVALCCQDDDPTYPIIYRKSAILQAGRLRVFTHQGEIKDQYVINRFIFRDTSTYNFWASVLINQPYLDTIRFISESRAVVTFNYATIQCSARNTISTIVLTQYDTTWGFTEGNEITHQVSYLIVKEKPEIYSEYLHSSTRGLYLFGFTAREKFVLKYHGAQISAPIIMFMWYHSNANSFRGNYVNNSLENDFYRSLEEKDTVSLLEYQLLFEKESH